MRVIQQRLTLKRGSRTIDCGIGLATGALQACLAHLDALHPQERNVLENYRYDVRKLQYLLGRLASKNAIQVLNSQVFPADIWIDFGIFQFPVVKGGVTSNVQVSISHTDLVGLALAFPEEHPMGVDLEVVEPKNLELLKTQMTKDELQLLTPYAKEPFLFALFGMKEALSKILRTGMMFPFHFLELEDLEVSGDFFLAKFKHFRQYQGISYFRNGLVCSLALPRRTEVDLVALKSTLDLLLINTIPGMPD